MVRWRVGIWNLERMLVKMDVGKRHLRHMYDETSTMTYLRLNTYDERSYDEKIYDDMTTMQHVR